MRERWKLIDRPDSVKFKTTHPKTHEDVVDFNSMEVSQQRIFKTIKIFVQCLSNTSKCYAYGSRINGRWVDNSDYDVAVIGNLTERDKKQIQEFDFGVKTDIKFYKEVSVNNCIEII